MSVESTLRDAIQKKVVVGFTFDGKNYIGSPHALGERDGTTQVMIYRGEDAHEKRVPPMGEWSVLPLANISDIRLLPGEAFHVGHPDAKAEKDLHKITLRVA
ncbi:hypothetical protein [Komagataeibacter oboediens]|uniref:WYL domain-containing protein n=1 Tax=Komagataeibacter oboediens TaxID=65958 RepID=A0A318QQA7_9PROT|nr:hypothetical protein [Komagataeibacter oboediens]GBR33814.1 hypothetical protein AA11826_1129 [Komagataeibacter oboediens DSM 11826]MBL7232607.1 hypothetical protein [Komagataeibacter oboediens]MBT0675264.1 hypothetical protein [Komagataeibacter oboediens]MBT0678875.1 hypothetical protein [Komagataeibacter oboediens]MBV0887996.1 hypothetical protein [Komagataeibacter oboediens]